MSEIPFLQDLRTRVASSPHFDWYMDGRPINSAWTNTLRLSKQNYAQLEVVHVITVVEHEQNKLHPHEKVLAQDFESANITLALLHSHKALQNSVRKMLRSK